jgi:N-acetylneuraminate synthase
VAASGAQALKLQTYTADTMTLDVDRPEFVVSDPGSPWSGETLHSLYGRANTPWDWHEPILRRARDLGLFAFSSAFDATAVDFLEELGVPAYKIASFENVDLPLIRRAASTGKPLIISTGMATVEELDEAVAAARASGCRELVLLKCTSSYPADPAESNLAAIPALRDRYGCPVGLSDHTLGIGAAVASVAFGAAMIEKHVTLDRGEGGVDATFSLEPAELAQLVRETAGGGGGDRLASHRSHRRRGV